MFAHKIDHLGHRLVGGMTDHLLFTVVETMHQPDAIFERHPRLIVRGVARTGKFVFIGIRVLVGHTHTPFTA